MKVLTLAALLIFLLADAGHAADKWLSVRSKNFLLVGNASESAIKRVARELEEFRAALASLFPSLNQQSTTGTTVVVFKDEPSFRPYKPLYEGKAGNVAGYFQPGEDVNFIALMANAPASNVIYHEFVHSLTKDVESPLPPWASEGFAEVYGMFELRGKDIVIGRAIGEHVGILNRERMLPLDVLFAVDRQSPHYNEKSRQGMFYAESWASVHYLMFGNNGKRRTQLARYLTIASNGKSVEENFREAFQTDFKSLEEEIRKYVQEQVAWPAIKMKLDEKLNFDREVRIASLSEAEAQYYLGDLLLHMSRMDDAETHLRKAVTLDPKLSAADASLGLLKTRQGRNDEALKFLAQAVERDSKNHLAHYYYVHMLRKVDEEGTDEESQSRLKLMRTHIERAIELAPRFADAYSMLGYVALLSRERLPEAENAVMKAIQFAPGRLELRLRLAELMIANGKSPAAQAVLTAVKNSGADDVLKYRADQLLENVRNQQENEKSLQEYQKNLRAYDQQRREAEEAIVRTTGDETADRRSEERPRIARGVAPPQSDDDFVVIETAKPQLEGPQGIRLEGLLTEVVCSDGLTLRVRVADATVELHTNTPERLEFMSYVATISDTIACGVLKPAVRVAVTYRRTNDRRFLGEPLRVDFIK
jgi:tetratricopeptide (TPR) repeat protein